MKPEKGGECLSAVIILSLHAGWTDNPFWPRPTASSVICSVYTRSDGVTNKKGLFITKLLIISSVFMITTSAVAACTKHTKDSGSMRTTPWFPTMFSATSHHPTCIRSPLTGGNVLLAPTDDQCGYPTPLCDGNDNPCFSPFTSGDRKLNPIST